MDSLPLLLIVGLALVIGGCGLVWVYRAHSYGDRVLTVAQGADDAVVVDADLWVSRWPRSAWRAGPSWAC